ncbi:MAG: hypothetical protein IPP83_12350 [Flavobacteriales bacterium]|nr:hypothetical protein [Flavobacteriales bacterium]MBL0128217.1 hypothetical protein [Flavobacteriales bacterium]MCC6938574.1 hypothetical protein [Flavobacteriales bacterium]
MNNRWPSAALALALGCLLFVALPRCEAQNLVPNPSFEQLDTCPYSIGFQVGDRPIHWYSWLNSPDYFHSCAQAVNGVDTLVGVPRNGWTFQHAWEGSAYVGMYSWGLGDFREYVGAELLEPLVVGCTYQLRFRVNPAADGTYWLQDGGTACDNVGLLFTTGSNAWYTLEGPPFPFRNFAHLYTTFPVSDTVAWTLVEGAFVADSAYSHIVLGNFFADSLTTALPIGNPNPWTGVTYYLIDGVEVIPITPGCHGVGVPDLVGGTPVVRFEAGMIVVDQMQEPFIAQVLDMVGRVLETSHWRQVGTGTMRLPTHQGDYVLQLYGERSTFVKKFVVH